jgi:MFS family permease
MTIVQALAFVDRQVLALLVEPIKRDLGASDTAMSLLYGLSFALFYVIVALPIARLADRSNRRNIIAVAVAVWSVMTALCGLARGFPQLLAARVGVGAGEAGLSPAAQSMFADYFPPARLALALGLFSMGIYLGNGLALLAGGKLMALAPGIAAGLGLGEVAPWRVVMALVGLPGLAVAALMLTVREPARRGAVAKPLPLAVVAARIGRRRWTYLGMIGGLAMMAFVANAANAWIPAFFDRKFGWDPSEVGARLGPLVLVFGAAGALAGGTLASFLRSRGLVRANLIAALAGFCVVAPIVVAFPLVPDAEVALLLVAGLNFAVGLPAGGGYAALQEMTPGPMRAQVTALALLCVNVVGAGLGPLAVGLCTDRLFGDPEALPQAIALVAAIGAPLTIGAYLLALRGHAAASAEAQDFSR